MPKPKEAIQYSVEIPDRPGALADFLRMMRDEKVNLKGLWSFQTGAGMGRVFVVPQSPEKFKKACDRHGYPFVEGITFSLSGADKAGALCDVLEKITAAGINLHAVDGITVGEKFGAYLWANPEDVDKLKKIWS